MLHSTEFVGRLRTLAAILALPLAIGCSPNNGKSTPAGGSSASSTAVGTESDEAASDATSGDSTATEPVTAAAGEFKFADLLTPFDPPTLAELDAKADWQAQPVVDALKQLRETKQGEPAPGATVDEALSLKNDSDEANDKIVGALSVLAPEDGTGVDFDARIRRAFMMDLSATNSLLTSSLAEQEIYSLAGFGLFGFDWQMNPFALADSVKSWQSSKDGMMDKVVIRDDMTWSDGKPITAHDIVFSFKTIMSSQVPVPAVRQGTEYLKWIEAYDDHTLVYFQKQAAATNVWNLNFPVIPKHLYEKSLADDPTLKTSDYHANLEKNPVVGGPYKLKQWSRAQRIVLERRDDYFMHNGKQVRDKPYFKEIHFSIIEDGTTQLLALKSGSLDESIIGAEQWQTQTEGDDYYSINTKVRGNEWTYFYFGWNLKDPRFSDVRVRKALAHVMNYDEMVDDLCFGLFPRCHGVFAPDAWMYPKDPAPLYQQDLDKAEDMLDEAGWTDSDGDGLRDKLIDGKKVPFSFTMNVSNKPDRIAICELFASELDSIGIECKVRPLDAATFQERMQNKKYQAAMSGWGTGADPYTLENIFGTGKERNYGSYSNPKVDELFQLALMEKDRAKRGELYGQIHNIIYEDQPTMFLYNQSAFYGFRKNLRGYRFSPRGPFHYNPGFSSIWPAQQ